MILGEIVSIVGIEMLTRMNIGTRPAIWATYFVQHSDCHPFFSIMSVCLAQILLMRVVLIRSNRAIATAAGQSILVTTLYSTGEVCNWGPCRGIYKGRSNEPQEKRQLKCGPYTPKNGLRSGNP